ncbi:hypothetical protein ES705_36267 [subsurface metagenome]
MQDADTPGAPALSGKSQDLSNRDTRQYSKPRRPSAIRGLSEGTGGIESSTTKIARVSRDSQGGWAIFLHGIVY